MDGRLELMNPPTIKRLLIVDLLNTAFKAGIKRLYLPLLCFYEAGVRTGRNKSRLTDLSVMTQEQAKELLNVLAVFESAPLMVRNSFYHNSADWIADFSRISDHS
jgi:Uma2 family endonuclease